MSKGARGIPEGKQTTIDEENKNKIYSRIYEKHLRQTNLHIKFVRGASKRWIEYSNEKLLNNFLQTV